MIRSLPRLLVGAGILVLAVAGAVNLGPQLMPRRPASSFVPPPPPSETAARAGNCSFLLQHAGRDAVPPDPPSVYGTRMLQPTQFANGAWDGGGRVLQVCGVDGHARPYRSEVLAFTTGSTITLINPVYWSGLGIQSIAGRQSAPSVAAEARTGSSVEVGCPGG